MFGEAGFRVCCSEIVVKGTLNFDCESMDEGVGLRVGDLGLTVWGADQTKEALNLKRSSCTLKSRIRLRFRV